MGSFIHRARRLDTAIYCAIVLCVLALYLATLLPGIGSGDTAELQRVAPTLGVAHPTGYPLYTILGWLWSKLPLGGTPAWRMNLFSAAAGALAAGALYAAARALGQRRVVAMAAALTLAVSHTFWSQATIAEVYALAALIQALLILALLRWRDGRWPLWVVGLLLGLGLAHHRTIILMFPGALAFLALSYRAHSGLRASVPPSRKVTKKDLIAAPGMLVAGCLLYLYLPLRAPSWLDSWQAFWQYVAGSAALSVWLTPDPPWRVAWGHFQELALRLIWPQFLPAGALLALLGAIRLWRRDRPAAVLLSAGYLLVVLFCTLFFVQDVEVFLIAAHLIAALLLGEGAMLLAGATTEQGDKETRRQGYKETIVVRQRVSPSPLLPFSPSRQSNLAWALLLLPVLLLIRNLGPIRAGNSTANEAVARSILAQPLPRGALLIVDWESVEGLRYLQAIEGQRLDVEVRPLNADVARQDALAALAAGRATYLLRPQPNLELAQVPEGRLWRVSDKPMQLHTATQADQHWQDGIVLKGYTLPRGPYQPGDIVPLTLDWQAQAAPARRYTMFVHIVGADGSVWAQQDREPAHAPTDQWRPAQRLVDVYGPALRLETPPGNYRVVIGWYSYPSLIRLSRVNAAGESEADISILGEIEVVSPR